MFFQYPDALHKLNRVMAARCAKRYCASLRPRCINQCVIVAHSAAADNKHLVVAGHPKPDSAGVTPAITSTR